MPANFTSLNKNNIRIIAKKSELDGDVTVMQDAEPVAAVCDRSPIAARIIDAYDDPVSGLMRLEYDIPHGLSDGQWIVNDQVFGNYAANYLHQVTVIDSVTVEIDAVSNGVFDPDRSIGYTYTALPTLEALVFEPQGGGDTMQYVYQMSESVPIVRGVTYSIFVWDVGFNAGDYFRRFEWVTN
jgi:hypothetical protein